MLTSRAQAAARLGDVHDKVLVALSDIPTILDGAQRVLHIYPESQRLESLSKTFYVSILAALGHIMCYLRKKASSRIPRACMAPFGFEADLVSKVDAISKSKDAFNEEADICQKEMLDRLNSAISHQGSVTAEEMTRMTDAVRVAMSEQKRANLVMGEMLEMIRRRQSDMGRDIKEVKTALHAQTIPFKKLLTVLTGGDVVQLHGLSMSACSRMSFFRNTLTSDRQRGGWMHRGAAMMPRHPMRDPRLPPRRRIRVSSPVISVKFFLRYKMYLIS